MRRNPYAPYRVHSNREIGHYTGNVWRPSLLLSRESYGAAFDTLPHPAAACGCESSACGHEYCGASTDGGVLMLWVGPICAGCAATIAATPDGPGYLVPFSTF